MSDITDNVPALLTELEDSIETGIKVLGSIGTNDMADSDIAAMNAFTQAKGFLQQLIDALGVDDSPGTQDDDSDANTGRSAAPERLRAVSEAALHLIHGAETLCGRAWMGHPEIRVRAEIGYITCRECKRKASEVARTG